MKTWLWLLALVLVTVALAQGAGPLVGAGLLALAALKARAILGQFLHLAGAPGWLAAVMTPLLLWLALIGTLSAL
ncbi:cytochrome C oxidase subunit IV family protein [Paracoccus sp. TOH]|uniref:Cytochrome C oxidase subunit IV family protein n=1 Tax=Paracoccus simplex TaxID=2086346 RepID=A0ABV7RVF9_9RHOB|nr:cytochrome C oxidase subunit IV family protein [Paracoccus sp. TOH]WJS84260.1 cytochrome C oxidase subunit IV family protein [Paracoccus sp. TOH]